MNKLTELYYVIVCFAAATAEDEVYVTSAMTKEEFDKFQIDINDLRFVEFTGKQVYNKDHVWRLKVKDAQKYKTFVNPSNITDYGYSIIEVDIGEKL